MRVRASDGRIIRLLHFQFKAKHLAILLELQGDLPNVLIEARDEVTRVHRMIPVYQLHLDNTELTFLNP